MAAVKTEFTEFIAGDIEREIKIYLKNSGPEPVYAYENVFAQREKYYYFRICENFLKNSCKEKGTVV